MAEFQVRRPGSTNFWVSDLSQEVVAGSTIDLYPLHGGLDLSNSSDLKIAINIGDLIRVNKGLRIPVWHYELGLVFPRMCIPWFNQASITHNLESSCDINLGRFTCSPMC